MNSKTFWVIFAIAAALRIFAIERAPLWYDENFTLILSRLPFDRMIAATAGDVHPPLWYLISWLTMNPDLGQQPWMIRLPAMGFSLASLWMFVKLFDVIRIPRFLKTAARPLSIPYRVRVIATFLMAVMPMQLWYAQEGRMYALLEFLVLAALYNGLRRKWWIFALSAIAMVYTQNYGIFYLLVIAWLLTTLDWGNAIGVTASGMITMMFYAPWFVVMAGQMGEIEGRYWIMDAGPGAVLGAIYKQFWASSMMTEGTLGSYFVTFALLIIGTYIMLVRDRSEASYIVLIMAFAPIAIAWIASLVWQPVLLFRPLIGVSPFLYIVAAWSVEALPPLTINRQRVAVLYSFCFIVPVLLFGVGGYYVNIASMKNDGAVSPLVGTLDYVTANWQDGDVIYYADDGPMINLMPYTSLPQYRMPECASGTGYAPVLGSLSDATRAALGVPIADLADVPHKRAWVFAPRSPLHPACYEEQIRAIAPEGQQIITVDDNQFIHSGVWLVEKEQVSR